mmetsp:Transcript_35685/g.63095  ORF Transcript_35685/g.63095 Transcript_35685/m.63095 type:complete len:128 (-) Transcript_35685:77-460(-)
MPKIEVVVNKKVASVEVPASGTVKDLMTAINVEEGILVEKQVLLTETKELRMPSYEAGKVVVFDGEERSVVDDKSLQDFNIDGKAPVVCGELQDEFCETVSWGAFNYTMFEADYSSHREFVVFNAEK